MGRRIKHAVVTVAGACILAGCGGEMSTINSAGEAANALSKLSWVVYITFLAVTAGMFFLILWPVFRRRRGSFTEHAPVNIDGGQSWLLVGGIGMPFVILSVLFVLGLRAMAQYPLHDGKIPAPEIVVTGHQWWWEVDYVMGPSNLHFATANEIHLPVGEMVDIEVVTADVIHSFWVPRLHGKVDLIPGMKNHIRLKADQAGVFRGQCAEFCGAQHAHMSFLVVAQPPDEFAAWLAHQRTPAAAPKTELARSGQEVFLSKPCSLCHSIRGVRQGNAPAPDLTHIGSRLSLAANTLENNKANLSAWITHAQSLKPEVMMPNITQMTGEELQALTAFLQGLK